jgi:hypothetical protein
MHDPGNSVLGALLLRAPPPAESGHNLVCEKFLKKSFENPKVPESGTDNGTDNRQSGRN